MLISCMIEIVPNPGGYYSQRRSFFGKDYQYRVSNTAYRVLGGVIKEWKLRVAKHGLLKSGDPNVWKTKGIVGHYKPVLVALRYGFLYGN